MGIILELLRRFGNATADAATGFLFSEDILRTEAEDERAGAQRQNSSGESPMNAQVKTPETVQDSPVDAVGQDLAESIESFGASHDQGTGPEMPSQEEGPHHSR